MTEQEVVNLMKSATSERDWNAKCDEVKRRCGGYPAFWFSVIVQSGLMHKITSAW